jgi:hypothetical protein
VYHAWREPMPAPPPPLSSRQLSDYQRQAVVAKLATIPGKVADTNPPIGNNGLMSRPTSQPITYRFKININIHYTEPNYSERLQHADMHTRQSCLLCGTKCMIRHYNYNVNYTFKITLVIYKFIFYHLLRHSFWIRVLAFSPQRYDQTCRQ